ncbi:hypothetical protein [Deinococcus hopiensis]|uniref:Uncharacterized protein n=1 Tax=Deinococcus hopiensis KR-140 TaxID=695939 RepID=A0A1W1UXK4_9DEIO|nr:hypothetical protein [Deinococcus hopiensis]SMB85835.1 hypothetical protein SAMN00790413_03561 [Deinococcus hopiensis KR-140]
MKKKRYEVRATASIGHRNFEIFDNQDRMTIASFNVMGRDDRTKEAVLRKPAEEYCERLNAEHDDQQQTKVAREAIWDHLLALPNSDVQQLALALERGGRLRGVVKV